MTYRKKRLLTIQIILIFTAILLMYLFYYQGSKSDKSVDFQKESPAPQNETVNGNFFEDVEYRGMDANGNRYLLQSKIATFDKDVPELINMGGMKATFYFKDNSTLYIQADNGVFNNKTLDMKFIRNVEATYLTSKLFAEKAEYSNTKNYLSIYENVRINDIKGNLIADKLLFDITSQKLDITSFSNGKINANVNLNEKRF